MWKSKANTEDSFLPNSIVAGVHGLETESSKLTHERSQFVKKPESLSILSTQAILSYMDCGEEAAM